MKHVKSIYEWMSEKSPEEIEIDNLIDNGHPVSPEAIEEIKNKKKKIYTETDSLKFEQDENGIKDFGSEIEVYGTLTYKNIIYTGHFTIPKDDDDRGRNDWSFFNSKNGEFEPEPDDFYNLDNLAQQIESDVLD